MKKSVNFLQFIGILVVLALPLNLHAKRKGTESGGGGGVAWLGLKYPVLIDYFTIFKSLDELPRSVGKPSQIGAETALNKNFDPAALKALNIFQEWKHLPYDAISANVLDAFHVPEWTFVDNKLFAPPFYISPSLPENAQISVAAFYYKSPETAHVKVEISKSIWNQLLLNDQAGLLIHETLRQVQIGYQNDYDDETLQRVTAIYLVCKPSGRLNYYIYFLLNNSIKDANRIYGSFEGIIAESCERKR